MRASRIIPLVLWLLQLTQPTEPNDFVEVCAGCASFSKAMRMSGLKGKEFDIRFSQNHDLMRTVGFMAIMAAVWNTRPGGLIFFAPPCSSWIFLSSSQTGRCWANPKGKEGNHKVLYANIFVRRMLYILFYAVKRGCQIVIEQPLSSVMWHWRPVRRFLQWSKSRRVAFPMGSYGARSLKMTVLWGTLRKLQSLRRSINVKQLKTLLQKGNERSQPKPLVKKSINKRSGKVQVTGNKKLLSRSANYPLNFGLAIASLVDPAGEPAASPEINITEGDPASSDDGAIDDLIKGRKHCPWRRSLLGQS